MADKYGVNPLGGDIKAAAGSVGPVRMMYCLRWKDPFSVAHCVDTIQTLTDRFGDLALARPMRVERYEAGTELTYDITGVASRASGTMTVAIEKFVGGGFAGQVYRVELKSLDCDAGEIPSLVVGEKYAMKILIPPSAGSNAFRNLIYGIGFQAPFSLQVNPTAARAGALWQTLIRRAARMRFGTAAAVTEIHATFIDQTLGSCGEISEWIDGRVWQFETDDHLETRKAWNVGDSVDGQESKEYLSKKTFMGGIVRLLHEMGAAELARQYEWWTCKSQPNTLKRHGHDADPAEGLTAVDFRAGLALLPFLPMSPGDIPLIFKGLARGSLVQFDRPNLKKLKAFVAANAEHFSDMDHVVEDLVAAEGVYRNSMPDITHNHVRLLYSPTLWRTMLDTTVEGWRIRGITDEKTSASLAASRPATLGFGVIRRLPALAGIVGAICVGLAVFSKDHSWPTALVGILTAVIGGRLGRLVGSLIGRGDTRRHVGSILTSVKYFARAFKGHVIEQAISWHRGGRLSAEQALALARHPSRYFIHRPLSFLPIFLHKLLTDRLYAKQTGYFIFVRPIRLLFSAEMREQWLREMVAQGRAKGMITDADADEIESQLSEPFIQKYLVSLVIHICTAPITQVVSIIVAIVYVAHHPEFTWQEGWAYALGIIALFQVVPISPGSLARGLYVTGLVIKERNFKDYKIALFMAYFKYIGYLSFPIQMAYRYPALARFMAAHWATEFVHVIPVFGERGALAEHGVFDLFYNYPLTARRRIPLRNAVREKRRGRYWHGPVVAGVATLAIFNASCLWVLAFGELPGLKSAFFFIPAIVAFFGGRCVLQRAAGAKTSRRFGLAAATGALSGVLIGLIHLHLLYGPLTREVLTTGSSIAVITWRVFLMTLLMVIGAATAEFCPAEPDVKSLDLAAQGG